MIENIRIQNFKSWRDTGNIRLAPITAFFGTNSSGKTSLLQMLLMLKQTTEASDRAMVLNLGDDRSLTNLGAFQEVIHAHDLKSMLGCQVEWTLPKLLKISDTNNPENSPIVSSDRLRFETNIAWEHAGLPERGRAVVQSFAYHFANLQFGMQRLSTGLNDYKLVNEGTRLKLARAQGRGGPMQTPTKYYGFPDEVRAFYQNAGFLADFELAFETLFKNIYYLGPLREYPKRQYAWAGARPTDMGQRGERVVDALLASRDSGAYIQSGAGNRLLGLEERVAIWLKELGLIESFEVRPIKAGGNLFQVSVKRTRQSSEVLITDVGFGVSQILPVITLCYYVPAGSTLILEQPEIHLHPSVQMGLADVFIDAAKSRNIQIILESHSEHLLRRLQRRMAENTMKPDNAALYFCATEQAGSVLNELKLDSYGNITNWPPDFFGDEFGEIAAMSEAALDRRGKQEAG